jgi:hypothetical protein
MLKKILAYLSLATLTLSLTSCIEMEQEFILNPDGSGKIKITQAFAMPDLGALGGEKSSTDKKDNPMARKMIVSLLKAQGIDAWADVKYEVGSDGKTRAQATGYFPDVTKVRVEGMNDQGQQGSGITKNSDGHWVLDMQENLGKLKEKSAEASTDKESAPTMTDEELAAQVKEQREQFEAQKGMMLGMLGTMKITTTLTGGGTILEATGAFEKKSDQSASFSLTGEKMIEGMSRLMADEENLKNIIKSGKDPMQNADPSAIFSALGLAESSKIVLKPTAPAFDYAKETAAAKKNISPELKKLLEEAKTESATETTPPGAKDKEE